MLNKVVRNSIVEPTTEYDNDHAVELIKRKERSLGVVYTPKVLADFVAKKVLRLFLSDQSGEGRLKAITILDPACGTGELLVSVLNELNSEMGFRSTDHGVSMFGFDIDKSALNLADDRLDCLIAESKFKNCQAHFRNINSLFPIKRTSSQKGWESIKKECSAEYGFDIIIANPPWGANMSAYKARLSCDEFSVYQRQYDSSDLFLELAIKNLAIGGYLAFIVPDSLFLQERKVLRKLILNETEIRFIGRLGEKFFNNVNRACAVLICKKESKRTIRRIQCLRLTPQSRRDILSGKLTFDDAEEKLAYYVAHDRFRKNRSYQFDLDTSPADEKTMLRITSTNSALRDHLVSARGVELSKRGKVYRCPTCKKWSPEPASIMVQCPHCRAKIERDLINVETIVSKKPKMGHIPLIVGESIRRYTLDRNYWIDTNRLGINYKPARIYSSPKILVRKTGVGMSAALDYTGSLTNQVVYILRAPPCNKIELEFYLGLLASRAVFYYLAKSHGETEWRSHPYLTQKQVLDIPVPCLSDLSTKFQGQVKSIVKVIRPFTKKGLPLTRAADSHVERLIAEIYKLDMKDYEQIFSSIHEAEDLLPVKALKSIHLSDIFPTKTGR